MLGQLIGSLELALVPVVLVLGALYLVVAGGYIFLTIKVFIEVWKQRKVWNPGMFLLISVLTLLTLGIYALTPLILLVL